MSYVKFEKNLSPSEAKYKYVGLVKSVREEFPEKDQNFTLKFKNKKSKEYNTFQVTISMLINILAEIRLR